MNKRRWFGGFGVLLLVAILFATWITVAAGDSPLPAPLVINNQTGSFIHLSLSGPQKFSFDVVPGWSTVRITGGVYHYSYSACGDGRKGAFEVVPSGARLNIASCRMVNVYIVNNTGDRLGLSLSGHKNYFFSLPEGTTRIRVLPGSYDFTAYGCGKTKTGVEGLTRGGKYWHFECN